jgi:uncharacterized Fe-S cluster-containing radical SAM superfamily protein
MPNQHIFCSSPWYELQIYWDGSLGFCCQENQKMYPGELSETYNVKNMSIAEWYNSKPMQQARMIMLGDSKTAVCTKCYHQEKFSGLSRRHKTNIKNVIFTNENFEESFCQSPSYRKFEYSQNNDGDSDQLPIDLHIDLGNYCNLACKMCWAGASSKIAAQEVKWGRIESAKYIGSDWTKDEIVWRRVLTEIAAIPKLNNIHFMGGETLITKRFEDFVDFMIERQRFDLNFSFVTNGTTFNESLMEKLLQFNRVGLEVSIETVTKHNEYQRQGTDTELVLANIRKYLKYCNNNRITLAARPAISLLTIGNYDTLLEYCLSNGLIVKSLLVTSPRYLDARILPQNIKQSYFKKYEQLLEKLEFNKNISINDSSINDSDPNQIQKIIKKQVETCLNILSTSEPSDADQQLKLMVDTCRQWDTVYGYNARELYPELTEIFDMHGY